MLGAYLSSAYLEYISIKVVSEIFKIFDKTCSSIRQGLFFNFNFHVLDK